MLGCCEQDAPARIRGPLEYRIGAMKLQKSPSVWAGMELSQEGDFSVELTQAELPIDLRPPPSSLGLWDARRKTLSLRDIELRQ